MRRLLRVLFTVLFAIASVAQERTYTEFQRSFREAREAEDLDALDRSIRLSPAMAVHHFSSLCKEEWLGISGPGRPAEVLEIQESMRGAWQRIYGDDTVLVKYQDFFRLQTDEQVAQLSEAEGMLRRAYLSQGLAISSRQQVDFEFAQDRFLEVARNRLGRTRLCQLGTGCHHKLQRRRIVL